MPILARTAICGLVTGLSVFAPPLEQPRNVSCEQGRLRSAIGGPMGYRDRSYGCEGFFVQPQSSMNVQVLSLVAGPLDLAGRRLVYLHVPPIPRDLHDWAAVSATGLTSGVNWALDGQASADRPMFWPLDTVFLQSGLQPDKIGIAARTKGGERFAASIYVAVRIDTMAEVKRDAAVPTVLTIRIPAAGSMRWRISQSAPWKIASPVDGDGRFDVPLPAASRGRIIFDLQWTPRGSRNRWSAIESVPLLLW